jgi:hypothetical protein
VAELARMLAGSDTPTAREHAAELLEDARSSIAHPAPGSAPKAAPKPAAKSARKAPAKPAKTGRASRKAG